MADILIRQRYREEFDGLTLKEMEDRINAGIWSGEKRLHAIAYVDEKKHGEERAHRAEQLRLQRRADRKGTISLIVSILAVGISALALGLSAWLAIHGLSSGLTAPKQPARALIAPVEAPSIPK